MRKTIDIVNKAPTAPDEGVLELVHSVMHLYRARQFQVLRGGPHAVTHMESKVLSFFGRHPGATPSDLAAHSGRDKAQLTRLVAGLRERRLLEGAADLADRRSVKLSLTAAGQSVQRALHQQAGRLEARAVAGMSAAEQQLLTTLLLRLRDNLA
ncbi:MAG TPA: MarR family transcriptional regulator [Rubrivivax sp.]